MVMKTITGITNSLTEDELSNWDNSFLVKELVIPTIVFIHII